MDEQPAAKSRWADGSKKRPNEPNTGTYTDYTLSPFEAVVAAYAQHEARDFNTWMYDRYHKMVTVCDSCKDGVVVVTCGNQSALAAKGKERG